MAHIMQVFRTGWFILKKLTLVYIQIPPAIPDANRKLIASQTYISIIIMNPCLCFIKVQYLYNLLDV